jgi:hypothetical protein
LSGLRLAYQTFDTGLKDTSCADCNTNRELIFLHAATRTAMLFIDNNDLAVNDSFLELADAFGVEVIGDYFDQLDIDVPLDSNGRYKIPADAPDLDEISNIVQSWIAEINDVKGIVAELDSISDSSSNRFRFFFEPDCTGLENPLEVDYGDLLILKGLLLAYKSQLESRLAYDVFLDVNETLLHKLLYEDGINPEEPNFAELAAVVGISDPNNIGINDDFLNPYPNLLKVLPTPGHTEDGAAILAEARADVNAAVDYYFYALDYIRSETDPQEDDLVYVDPNDTLLLDVVNGKLTALRDSLKNDTVMTYPRETTKIYDICDVNSVHIGQLVLVYDFTGIGGDNGSLTFEDTNLAPSPWDVEWFGVEDGNSIEIELEYSSESQWREGYFEGTLSEDGNNITSATFEYWGYSSGDINNLSGQLVQTDVCDVNINLNPIFGSSPNYPAPVNPRDLLPRFDQENTPVPCTFGHGLGNDATLGGILPDMTQQDWITLLDLGFLKGDSDIDCDVDLADYAVLASHWLNQNCTEMEDWCDRTDIDQSGKVDIFDLAIFAEYWLEGTER